MKSFIVFALFVAAAVAVPVDPKDAVITQSENNNIGVGPYNFGFQSSDGTNVAVAGNLKNEGTDAEALEVRGQFTYVGVDGLTYSVEYVANELGFQPRGAHLPVAPSQ